MAIEKTYALGENNPFFALRVGFARGKSFKDSLSEAVKVFSTRTVTVCDNEKLEKMLDAGVEKGWAKRKYTSDDITKVEDSLEGTFDRNEKQIDIRHKLLDLDLAQKVQAKELEPREAEAIQTLDNVLSDYPEEDDTPEGTEVKVPKPR